MTLIKLSICSYVLLLELRVILGILCILVTFIDSFEAVSYTHLRAHET